MRFDALGPGGGDGSPAPPPGCLRNGPEREAHPAAIIVDDLTRIMTMEAERLSGIDAHREAHTCRQVAEWFSSDVLSLELDEMGGE